MNDLLQLHRRIALQGPRSPGDWLLFLVLLPAALLYGVVGLVRSECYQHQFFPVYRAPVPVISVGNLAAGGTGKTPVVDSLVKLALAEGKKPAIISRGYGGRFPGPVGIVSSGTGPSLSAVEAGDEPFLLARRNPEAVVLIARKRADGARMAIDRFAADLIILDDGFQHRAMARDLDLVLLDASRPLANHWPLPAGLLREFPIALARADLFMLTRSDADSKFSYADKPVFRSRHQFADHALDLAGAQISWPELRQLKLCAFAGIAAPEVFFSALSESGLTLVNRVALDDHCAYDSRTLEQLRVAAAGCDALVTTEKDAVKLKINSLPLPCYQVPLTIVINEDKEFRQAIKTIWS